MNGHISFQFSVFGFQLKEKLDGFGDQSWHSRVPPFLG
jgi:hypothetical protein